MKFVFTDKEGLVFSWVRAGSSDYHLGPHVDFPGGKVEGYPEPGETFLQAAHRELGEELALCSQIVTKVNNLLTYVSKHV